MILARLMMALSVLAGSLVLDAPASAQPTIAAPDEQQIARDKSAQALVDALAAKNYERFRAWFEEHAQTVPAESEVRALFDRVISTYGGFAARRFLLLSEDIVAIEGEAGDGGKVSLRFGFVPGSASKVQSVDAEYTPPKPPVVLSSNWSSLQDLVDEAQQATGVPALAVGFHHKDVTELAVAGFREAGGADHAHINDGFDWASVGKSITGSLMAALVERGVLRWDSTIAEVFGDDEIHPAYRAVPLWMLASHQAGVPPHTNFDMTFEKVIAAQPGDGITSKRAAHIGSVLREAPVYTPGEEMEYSNGGYMVMGLMAERATGRSLEDLIRQYVLNPLRLEHSAPRDQELAETVSGHVGGPGGVRPVQRTEELLLPKVIAAAGGISGSIGDLTTFAVAHLRGLNGEDTGLARSETISMLHQLQPGQKPFKGEIYSFGWGDRCVVEMPAAVLCRSHNGGNGMTFAQILVIPELDIAFTLLANHTETGVRALEPVLSALMEKITPG